MIVCLGVIISIFFLAGSQAYAAEKPPIKVGLLLPYTGTMPFQTKGVNDAVELYFSEVGGKAGGRTVQIIKEDDEQNPTAGLTKARRLMRMAERQLYRCTRRIARVTQSGKACAAQRNALPNMTANAAFLSGGIVAHLTQDSSPYGP